METRPEDFELLRDFARRGDQAAFATVVRRHVDLVYATALRKVDDAGAAEEVAQNVFAALARKAWRFAPDDSLPAWLHRTTLLEARQWWRSELRRRRREQTAAELGTTMKTPDEQSALRVLAPLLDEALLTLREQDRAALLLRFYENQPLRDVGAALRVNEDTAQKRVSSALDKLVRFFQRRGFKTATTVTTEAVLRGTAVSAPAAVSASILQGATQAAVPAMTGVKIWLARLAGLTKTQAVAICLLVAAVPLAWQTSRYASAKRSANEIQIQLEAARAHQQEAGDTVDGLRSELSRVDVALNQVGSPDQGGNIAATLAAFRARAYGTLAGTNPAWADDSYYVRIPKSVITNVNLQTWYNSSGRLRTWFNSSGVLSDEARELLGITAEESVPTERALEEYWRTVNDLTASRAYETNLPDGPSGPLTKTVVVPALGQDLKSAAQDAAAQITQALGAEREHILFGGWDEGGIRLFWPANLWKIADQSQTFTVSLDPGTTSAAGSTYKATRVCSESSMSGPPNQLQSVVPEEISARFFTPWLQEHGVSVR